MTSSKRRECLRDKNGYQSINLHGFSKPNKKRSDDALMDKRNGTDDRQEAETRSFSSNSKGEAKGALNLEG